MRRSPWFDKHSNEYRLSKNEKLCSSAHRVNKNKMDYCVTIKLQQLVARSFAKDRENITSELSLNVIVSFYIISVVLRLRGVPNKGF